MILVNNNDNKDATLNLALDEWCVRNLDVNDKNYILFYINSPSIIIGKHQNTIEEINSEYVEQNNIKVVRRISGGGAVYHDEGNLNFSFITKYSHDSIHNFKKFTAPVIKALHSLSVDAILGGRNDITVDGRKISGNAQFSNTRSMFSHGTLLFDSKIENVVEALNVRAEKIESKGIKSVKSRVANIKEFLKKVISIEEFKNVLIENIFDGVKDYPVYNLSDKEWAEVEKIADTKYRTWEWNYGRSPEFNIQKINRFDFGQIDARINVKDGIIKDIKLFGDFLGHGEMKEIEERLTGKRYEEKEIENAISDINLNEYIGNINKKDFANFLYI
ncbi:MAG TPA: lipoate--protein ligase [Bacteroidetes bacterium]|nr:lipoate--protein ligase [Bacteroidota bacterium]HCN36357.1 lipoate--protein ligase [Bacteroidota bacterium]